MATILHYFERGIVISIIVLMMITILVSTIELGVILHKEFMAEPQYLLDVANLTEIFGFFFMILIGLELLHTIKTYLTEESRHVEIVFLVAMIAVARKIIVLELKKLSPLTLVGLGALIIALSAGYFLIKRTHHNVGETKIPTGTENSI
ncbi:phosphate-starvation-inducible E-like protein [candidate division KSB1 bacterium]|nr:phosphate-starvation-inducible E-like protein [candidate division KSB1 bacterium]